MQLKLQYMDPLWEDQLSPQTPNPRTGCPPSRYTLYGNCSMAVFTDSGLAILDYVPCLKFSVMLC